MIYKRLLNYDEKTLLVNIPVSDTELKKREKEYELLTPKKFSFSRSKDAFKPISFHWNNQLYEIQYNVCSEPLCKNHGLPQERFDIKSKPSRYRLTGEDYIKDIVCNPERREPDSPPTGECKTRTFSNWSLAEEIERLIRINSVVPVEKEYEFHKPHCSLDTHTPKKNPKSFHKRGINSAKSQRIQCKECKKITSISPDKTKRTTFNQNGMKLCHYSPGN